jgi:hypothetical protein
MRQDDQNAARKQLCFNHAISLLVSFSADRNSGARLAFVSAVRVDW